MSHTHKGVVTRSTILCLIGLCILGVVSGGGMISWTSVYLTNLKHTHNIQTHPSKMRPLPSPDWSINEQIWDSRMCRTSIFLRSSHIPHSWMPTFLYNGVCTPLSLPLPRALSSKVLLLSRLHISSTVYLQPYSCHNTWAAILRFRHTVGGPRVHKRRLFWELMISRVNIVGIYPRPKRAARG